MPQLALNMLVKTVGVFLYGAVFLSLFSIDYVLGNGVVDMSRKFFCRMLCFLKKAMREEEKPVQVIENPINLPVLFLEIFALCLTIAFLNRYKQYRSKDRLDDLLNESKESLRQTNEFLEKWRLRRINWQVPSDYSYLDEEPQDLTPFKLEVPILHMAIVDSLGSTKSQPERGDAGDTINITDATILSVTSLLDEDLESIAETLEEKALEEKKSVEFKNRYLWDVVEEDVTILED